MTLVELYVLKQEYYKAMELDLMLLELEAEAEEIGER